MSGAVSKLAGYGKRRIAFTIIVLAVLAFFLIQSWKSHAFLIVGWFENGLGLFTSDLEQDLLHIGHRLHEVALSLMMWPVLFGLLAQLRSPTRHVTGMLIAVLGFVAGLIAVAVTGTWRLVIILAVLGVPTLIAALIHPAGRDLIASFDRKRVSRILLALTVVAAVPLIAYAAHETGLQTGAIEPAEHAHGGGEHEKIHEQHIEGGHFTRMVWLSLAIIFTGFLASFRQPGWWLGAWVVGLMAVVFGLSGVLAPEAASNPGFIWDLAAIAWGVGFIAAAEFTQDEETPTWLGMQGIGTASAG